MVAVSDRFELLYRVAGSDRSSVWKARDRGLDRLVALKILDAPTPSARETWRAEARRLAGITDPHVVSILGYEESDDNAIIVEEWVEGASLSATLRHTGPLSTPQALGVIRGALLGLSHLHHNGMVHGDVSPTNILVDSDGLARLLDLGSATEVGRYALPATRAYAAPEVTVGAAVTPASDVFAAAAVLALLLRGAAMPSPTLDGVEANLRPVLTRAMAADPSQRYPDAAAFLAALEQDASRHYGAAWWTQAGLGGAAAAALTAAVTSAGTAAGATAAALTPAGPSAGAAGQRVESVVETKSRRPPRVQRMTRPVKVAVAGGVAAVAAGAIIAVAVANSNDGKPTAAATTGANATPLAAVTTARTTSAAPTSTSAAPTSTSAAPTPIVRSATYTYTFRITGKTPAVPGGNEIGDTSSVVWTATGSCVGTGPCDVTIRTAGGTPVPIGTGNVLVRDFKASGTCDVDGSAVPTSGHQELTVTRGADGMPESMTGTVTEDFAATARCTPVTYTSAITVTRTG